MKHWKAGSQAAALHGGERRARVRLCVCARPPFAFSLQRFISLSKIFYNFIPLAVVLAYKGGLTAALSHRGRGGSILIVHLVGLQFFEKETCFEVELNCLKTAS